MGERDEDRYRLSDGRDAREVVGSFIERLRAARENREQERPIKRDHVTLMKTTTHDDKEKLLEAANERLQQPRWRGQGHQSIPRRLEMWLATLKLEAVHGGQGLWTSVKIVLSVPAMAVRWGLGQPPDVRDARMMARELAARVESLARWHGDGNQEADIAAARDTVLEDVPTRYRKKVLEKLLDIEEEALRDSGAPSTEIEALESAREVRRAAGARLLLSRKPSGQSR